MDPNETLRRARAALARIRASEAEYHDQGAFEDLADTFEDLDKWLSFRGFLPMAWDACKGRNDR